METANAIGQMVAQLVNKLRPERMPHPQIKLDMPDCYKGDLAEIDNWSWSMETYFMLTKVTNLNQTIVITLQQIKKGKGNQLSRRVVGCKAKGMGRNGERI